MVRKIRIILFFVCFIHSILSAQQLTGIVVNEKNEGIYGVKISCGNSKTFSDFEGKFSFRKLEADSIFFYHNGYLKNSIHTKEFSENLKVVLKPKVTELDETKIVQSRLNKFDIGYLPPVRGVQISTGTSSIIQTEGQGGAKSTGNPRELFAKVPGLNIWESDGAGIQMGVGGRGLSPNRAENFNTRQNGYDISADALGYPESYYTPPLEALSAIEIIRGSASLQYGTQFGGLMNFVIKEPIKDSPFEFTSRNTLGSFGYIGFFNRISGSHKRSEYQIYHQLKLGDGYRDNSKFNQHQVFTQFGFNFTENQHLKIEYTGMTYAAQQPGGLTDKMYEDNSRQSVRERNWFQVNWNILALDYNYQISSKSIFNIRAFGMHSDRYSLGFLGKINQADLGGNRELISGNFRNGGTETRFLTKYSFKLKNLEIKSAFLTGLRFYKGKTQSDQGLAPDGNEANFSFINDRDLEISSFSFPSQNLAFFVENIWFIGDRFTFNTGFRLEYIKSSSTGFYKQYAIHPLNHDTLGVYKIDNKNQLTRIIPLYGLGSSYKVSKQTNFYGNFCLNYRAVNFTDIRINNPNIIVDTLIKDEYGSTTELGFRGLIKSYLYFDLALFYLFYGDKIGLAPEINGTKKIRTNIGDAQNMGIETFFEFDFVKMCNDSADISSSIFVNFSYIQAKYVRSKETNYIGKYVEYVSPIIFKSGIKFKTTKFQTQIQFSYNGGQFSDATNSFEASGDAVIGYIPSYFVVDYSVRYNFKKFFQVEAGINNMLNAKYYTRRAAAYPGPGILPSDGRSFYVTLQFKFKK